MQIEEKDGFYIGQKVVIRGWDEMVDEFGVHKIPNEGWFGIPCIDAWFTNYMRHYCGAMAEIVGFTERNVLLSGPVGQFHYNCHMIKPLFKEPQRDLLVDEAFSSGLSALI